MLFLLTAIINNRNINYMNDEEYVKMIQQRDLNLNMQKKDMSEEEIAKIIDNKHIKTLLRTHQLSNAFLHTQIIPRLDSETNLADVERLQKNFVKDSNTK
jgi:hypothetical protein